VSDWQVSRQFAKFTDAGQETRAPDRAARLPRLARHPEATIMARIRLITRPFKIPDSVGRV